MLVDGRAVARKVPVKVEAAPAKVVAVAVRPRAASLYVYALPSRTIFHKPTCRHVLERKDAVEYRLDEVPCKFTACGSCHL